MTSFLLHWEPLIRKFKLGITKVFKRDVTVGLVEIVTGMNSGDCGFPFDIYQRCS